MKIHLDEQGIITKKDWYDAIQTDEYDDLARYASEFRTAADSHVLRKYLKKWGDPIKHCSRKFEYPYVYQMIKKITNQKEEEKILDVGSGLSFFPFFLKSRGYNIISIDIDPIVEAGYAEIARKNNKYILVPEFHLISVVDLSCFIDNSFSIVYSVSVLEHIPLSKMESIFKELNRVIKKDGSLILTFDISLDGKRPIDIKEIKWLVSIISKYFTGIDSDTINKQIQEKDRNASTDWFKIHHPSLLPWPAPTFRERYGLNRKLYRLHEPFFSSIVFYRCVLKAVK